jgi:DNA-binding MarR family transcriptional regulator
MDFSMSEPRDNSILPMSQSFGHSLRQVNRLIQRDLGARVARLGLTSGQWYVLRTLWHTDGLTQIELAQKSGIAGPGMVIAVRSLLAMGLVTRRRPPNDKRKYVISLTEKGAKLEESALQAALDANNEALAGVAANEVEICMRVLGAAYANLMKAGLTVEGEPEVDTLIE